MSPATLPSPSNISYFTALIFKADVINFIKVRTLKELFETVEIHKNFDYLKEIGLINKV